MKIVNITHLTSAHPRYDTRIFVKECCSLAGVEHYKVSLIVADGKGDEQKDGVEILDVGPHKGGRLSRMTDTVKRVYNRARALESDLYHFHDPELIPVALKLKKTGKKVIFDIHEDVPKQILAKPYLNRFSKQLFSALYRLYENHACAKFDALITPTPIMNRNFSKQHPRSVQVANYPILTELANTVPWQEREDRVCHVGSLAESRGVLEIIEALSISKVPLDLCGDFRPHTLEQKAKALDGWSYVAYHGFVSREEVAKVLKKVKIGLVTLHPTPSYLEALPVKMFEYMAAGIPVIASDFPLYRELLAAYPCALFVDPLDPQAIAEATTELLDNQKAAEKMGEVGKEAAMSTFNWTHEEQKLLQLYRALLS